MTDELAVCVAAFFRSVGKEVTTSEDFVMTTSLQMKWMSPSDSKALLALLKSSNMLIEKDGYIRPNGDVSTIDVPLAYRPSPGLIERIRGGAVKPAAQPVAKKEVDPDMFHTLMAVATSSGMKAGDFVKGSNSIQKRLNIDIAVAGLIMLRDNGVGIEEYTERVYLAVSGQ